MFLDSNWRRELLHAARRLRNAPGFAAVAIVTLAIGVGVNTAMFGLIDSLLFRPPAHVTDPDRVVRVQFTSGSTPWGRQNYPAYQNLAATGVFASVAGYANETVSIGRGVDAYEARAMIVTPSFFRLLGVRPHAGSLFGTQPGDTLAENHVVLSYGFWESRFGRDPRIIGAPLAIGTSSYVVSGIAPGGFTSLQDQPVDVWLPLNDAADGILVFREWRTNRRSYWLDVVARVPPATTTGAVEERAGTLLRLAAQDTARAPSGIVTRPILASRRADKSREVRVALWLAGVAAFVLLIACANIANLILARNVTRSREYAVRLSLGASHWDLRRQLIADVCAVAVPGLLAALLVEYAVRTAIPAFLATEVPIPRGLLDARALALMSVSALVAVALVSIVSLVQVRPAAIVRALTTQVRESRRGGAWTRGSLVALQSGVCVALLFSAGLFAKSLSRVLSLDLGVDLDRTVQVSFNIPRGSRTPVEIQSLYERALERVRALAVVERAALSGWEPFRSGSGASPSTAERTVSEIWGEGEAGYSTAVGAGFFASVGARSLEGRDFTDDDKAGAPLVVIVNANMARRLWPNGGGLGNCLFMDDTRECYRVVGVLGGVWKLRALDRAKRTIYTPLAQTPGQGAGALLVRTRGALRPMLGPLRAAVQGVEPDLPAINVSPARDFVAREFRPWRLGATLFAGFSVVALIIAAVGLYGVVSFTTTLRTREIGVRMSLGARGSHIMRVVAGAGLGAVVAGLILGAGASLVASRWMGDVLYQTSPRDPVVLAQTAVVLLIVAVVAVITPVIRALRLAPAAILRSE